MTFDMCLKFTTNNDIVAGLNASSSQESFFY